MIGQAREAGPPPPSPRTPQVPTGAWWIGHLAARSPSPAGKPSGAPQTAWRSTVCACRHRISPEHRTPLTAVTSSGATSWILGTVSGSAQGETRAAAKARCSGKASCRRAGVLKCHEQFGSTLQHADRGHSGGVVARKSTHYHATRQEAQPFRPERRLRRKGAGDRSFRVEPSRQQS